LQLYKCVSGKRPALQPDNTNQDKPRFVGFRDTKSVQTADITQGITQTLLSRVICVG